MPLHETEIKKKGQYQLKTANGNVFTIASGETTIGREGNIAFPDDKFISRAHAKIVLTNNTLTIKDLNSQNGTFINGKKIHKSQDITLGDKIKCGNTNFTVQKD